MKALRGNLHKAVSLLLKKKATNALFKKKNQTPILSNTQAGNDLKDFLISWVFVFSYFFFFLTELQMLGIKALPPASPSGNQKQGILSCSFPTWEGKD